MKITTYGIVLALAVLAVSAEKAKTTYRKQVEIRPRVADVVNNFQKVVKPLVEKPFLPQEVKTLGELHQKRRFYDDVMTPVQTVGGETPHTSEKEKPSLYTTVISSHNTGILHPQPQPHVIPVRPEQGYAFSSEGFATHEVTNEEAKHSAQNRNSMNIPVTLSDSPIKPDPTLANYETPQFIKKKEKIMNLERGESSGSAEEYNKRTKTAPANEDDNKELVTSFISKNEKKSQKESEKESEKESAMNMDIGQAVENDIKNLLSQFDNSKDRADKIKAMADGKVRLKQETDELEARIRTEVQELLQTKRTALRLNNLLNKYEEKMIRDQKAQMKLADEITIKDLLRQKLQREMQGFRVSDNEYEELKQVNPDDIHNIVAKINKRLN